MDRTQTRWLVLGLGLTAVIAAGAWADWAFGWVTPAFDFVAHQFYEIPMLGRIRRPSQLVLVRWHLGIWAAMAAGGLMLAPWLGRHARIALTIFWIGYAIRATAWICGGNVPLVPGDSSHYIEVATSVYRGQGPVKHYVESFFNDYPRIRLNQGVLDDWATPLDAYVRAATFRLTGVAPGASIDATIAAAKGCSFLINLLALPALYGFARRRFGPVVGLTSMAVLAVLPVHAIYAGFVLRESLVALTSILAVWTIVEVWNSNGRWASVAWTLLAGLCGGLSILARNTGLALVAASGLNALVRLRRRPLLLVLWGVLVALTILPWAVATTREYGRPFYAYTSLFEYNFSWTVHHFDRGNTRPEQFYTWANAPEIVRTKIKSLIIIAVYSTMIVGLPLAAGYLYRLRKGDRGAPGRDVDVLTATIFVVFVAATIKSVADVTQVAQLGRYYLPVYVVMIPTAIAGVIHWVEKLRIDRRAFGWLAASYVALVWADPTWAYDASWFSHPYQLHWPALREAGEWIKEHPERVPPDARVMTWFPWEIRVTSDRTTVLMPRNYSAARIDEIVRQYNVTHILWGSFDAQEHVDPETWGPYLEQVRTALGLTTAKELHRSPREMFYPVRLYRLR
ncbi:MAG: glycosyltransferase family 39 protein [Paludisphaera borealis]|uniref:ArnT family glycosyltransferase n=1 Tax=Paludisphaera borealis TaxID=1387353 RepID=UPI002849DEB5|nr:glycosyltransferase family 39 protein [Paludisphaera borealis]MDR3621515.1 glycosyltransferase family 39 protein [Paludisphaera borealis]